MNAVCRSLCAAVCLLAALLPGFGASAQFLQQDIIQADPPDAQQRRAIANFVDPLMDQIIAGDPDGVSAARGSLLRPLRDATATAAFKLAMSQFMAARMDPAVNHDESVQVRMNAMILLGAMTDEGSMAQIEAGLEDESVAVQARAMDALRSRAQQLLPPTGTNAGANPNAAALDALVDTIKAKLDMVPHPIVVTPGLEALIDIGTNKALNALVAVLNDRVAVHAADANLSYAGEQAALFRISQQLVIARPFNQPIATGISRAAFRHGLQIVQQVQAGAIRENKIDGQLAMLNQAVQTLGQLAAGAGKQPPAAQLQANNWIVNGRWDDLMRMLENDWAAILGAAPFGLDADALTP